MSRSDIERIEKATQALSMASDDLFDAARLAESGVLREYLMRMITDLNPITDAMARLALCSG